MLVIALALGGCAGQGTRASTGPDGGDDVGGRGGEGGGTTGADAANDFQPDDGERQDVVEPSVDGSGATDLTSNDVRQNTDALDGEIGLAADATNSAADSARDSATDDAPPPKVDAAATEDVADARAPEAGAGADAVDGGSDVQLIHYYGRWNRLADRAITVNSGSHVTARFSGTGVTARFNVSSNLAPLPTLVWRVDQGAWQETELAATVVLAAGLTAGAHDLLLMARGLNEYQNRWTPPLISSITFLGIDVSGGALQLSARPTRPKIEFLGDSITEGVALWPVRPGKDSACWRADGRLGYASQTAQSLGAEWRQVGFGGQGLLKGGNGGVPVFNDAFNWIYGGVRRDDWRPDMVIINAGTVDRTDLGPGFRPAYAAYVSTLRAGYPDAKIVALRPFGGYHGDEIKAEVASRNTSGDLRVFYVDTTGWLSTGDFTDGIHPNAQGSTKAAESLAAAIRKIGLP